MCTLVACAECPPPRTVDPGVSCAAVLVVARNPTTGDCCEYSDPCHAPEGWDQFSSQQDCRGTTTTCQDGETMPSPDGCNTCSCFGGQWACTERACIDPKGCGGWLGDTCSDTEYCAYEEGQYCGAADASSVCQPRPQACETIYAPVCGCDGNTYGNSCEAAMNGTGVNSSGACQ